MIIADNPDLGRGDQSFYIKNCYFFFGGSYLGRVGEIGELSVGSVGDVAVWSLTGPAFAGAIADPIEAWLRCGPVSARDTIVHGEFVVREHELVSAKLETMLKSHAKLAHRMQKLATS